MAAMGHAHESRVELCGEQCVVKVEPERVHVPELNYKVVFWARRFQRLLPQRLASDSAD